MPETTIDLRGFAHNINEKFIPLIKDRHPLQVIVGGANSSKSYSYAQKIVYHCIREKYYRCLATRKVKKDVKHSVYDQLREVLYRYKLENYFNYNNTESNLTCKINGNDILGVGLDDVNKLKSFTNPTMFWAEEADQMHPNDIEQLSLRLRGPDYCFFQGGLTLNPINAQHWIKLKYFDHKDENVLTHHSTYHDNRFLPAKIIKRMESITDPYYVKVYVNGEWGIFSNGVFSNYIIEDFPYTENDLENVCYGMDFGFTHAQAIECVGFKDGEIYVFDELWEKNRTNPQFIEDAEEYFGDKLHNMRMTADSANPDKIEEWNQKGYSVEKAKKGQGSLKFGIEYLIDKKIHIHEKKCSNLAKEIQQFRRREDKNGEVTEDYVEVNDDGIAALRYATEYIWSNMESVRYYESNESDWTLDDLGL
jgi:phage terminase large subunit